MPSLFIDNSGPSLFAGISGVKTTITTDVLPQYAFLNGRTGGQTLLGGTASGENLTLGSTLNATKGLIKFGNSAYDEVNNRLGLGTITPSRILHVSGTDQTFLEYSDTVDTNTTRAALRLNNKTTLDMVDGFGVTILFQVEDSGFGPGNIGQIGTERAGSDSIFDMFFTTVNGGLTEHMRIQGSGRVGIGTAVPGARLHVDQSSTIGAIPVLYLDQADISEEMIEFDTTIGVGNAIEAVGAKTLTTTHFIKVTLPGPLTRYIPAGTIA
jgi:hypothetical protein